jgi:hypothetical protein
MDGAFLSVASALDRSVVGRLISGIVSWTSQRFQARAGQFVHEILLRECLYMEFIAVSESYNNSIVNDQPQIEGLADLQAMIARMRIGGIPEATGFFYHRDLSMRAEPITKRGQGGCLASF